MHIELRKILLISILFIVGSVAFAFSSISEVFPNLAGNEIDRLLSGETIKLYQNELNENYLCNDSLLKQRFEEDSSKEDNWTITLTSFISYPQEMQSMSEEQKLIHVYNTLKAISTLKGITYISYSNGDKPTVLFEDAYMISNPNKKNSRIDDPVIFEKPPKTDTAYSYQKDSRFGGNVYKLSYLTSDNEVFLDINNSTTMKYMGFTCLDKESLSMCVDAFLTDEGIVVSALATVTGKPTQVKVLTKTVDLPSAFMKRIVSLNNWFKQEV